MLFSRNGCAITRRPSTRRPIKGEAVTLVRLDASYRFDLVAIANTRSGRLPVAAHHAPPPRICQNSGAIEAQYPHLIIRKDANMAPKQLARSYRRRIWPIQTSPAGGLCVWILATQAPALKQRAEIPRNQFYLSPVRLSLAGLRYLLYRWAAVSRRLRTPPRRRAELAADNSHCSRPTDSLLRLPMSAFDARGGGVSPDPLLAA